MTTVSEVEEGCSVELYDGMIGTVVSRSIEKIWENNNLREITMLVLDTVCGLIEVSSDDVAIIL